MVKVGKSPAKEAIRRIDVHLIKKLRNTRLKVQKLSGEGLSHRSILMKKILESKENIFKTAINGIRERIVWGRT